MINQSAVDALADLLGPRLNRSEAVRRAHGQNESWYPEVLPDFVAMPKSTAEVSEILRLANHHGFAIVAWGQGTSLEGQALAIKGGLVLDMSEMAGLVEVSRDDMSVSIQPGMTRKTLEKELRATGLFFPVDPGADASLGGMVATRASGTTAVRYGTLKENVLALEVVLADGRIIKTGTKAPKSSAGYDLTSLFVGSEGTLGIITEITLRLHGQPEAVSAATCAFEQTKSAINSVIEIIQSGIPVARIEFVDRASIQAINAYSGQSLPLKPHLFLEFHGSKTAVDEQSQLAWEVTAAHGGQGFNWSSKPEERSKLWHARHSAYYAVKALKPGCLALVTDVCVPISKLGEAIEESIAEIEASHLDGPIVGHVGDGNFHAALLLDPDKPADLAEAKRIVAAMNERALRLGGTVTGEHGVGMGKLDYMSKEHGQAWQVMGDIKRTLDPNNILNPGKLVQQN